MAIISFLAAYLLFAQQISCLSCLPWQESGNRRLRTVYEFPNNTWVENIAVRPNGNLLVTLITSPEVWEIDPKQCAGRLIYHFPHVSSGFGIAEIEPDVFAVSMGNYSTTTFLPTPGTYSMWTIDFTKPRRAPTISKITDIPEAQMINGVTLLPGQSDVLLLGDSFGGLIYRLHTETRKYSVWADDPLFHGNTSVSPPLGINGLQLHGDDIYFTNSFALPVLGRIHVTQTGNARLPPDIVAAKPSYPTFRGAQADDFAFDEDGTVWLTTGPSNTLVKITRHGKQTAVAGGLHDGVIAGNTAAAFGRPTRHRQTLYVTTNGGLANAPQTGIVGGKVIAFDTRGW